MEVTSKQKTDLTLSVISTRQLAGNQGLPLNAWVSALAARLDPYAVLLAVVSLLALGPMLQPGYFWGAHDARHSVYFLFEFDHVFQDGVWYPRWFSEMTYGYGYPLFNIYGPLAFYVGEFFHLIGFDFVAAVKIVFGLSWVLSGLAMYGLIRRVFDNKPAAFIAGLAYVFMPYHLIDVYVRAALAESVALVFLPLTLWAFYETVNAPRVRTILFAAFAYAGMVFAHNGIALLFSVVLGAWILFLMARRVRAEQQSRQAANEKPSPKRWFVEFVRAGLPTLGALLLGLGLTGIFMLPLVAEYKYINVAQWTANYYDYQEHFVELYQLFSPTWGFGISLPGPVDGLSFQLGLVPLILSLFALFVAGRNTRGTRPQLAFFFLMTLVVILFMFNFSLPLWQQLFGLAGVAQFPWRLLTLTTVSLSILAGAVLLEGAEERSTFSLAALVIAALILLGSYAYITSQNYLEAKEGPVGFQGLMRFEKSANEMTGTTVYADEQPTWSPLADNIMGGVNIKSKIDFSTVPKSVFIRITKDGLHTNGERVDYNAPDGDTPITFNVQNYPGWRAYLTKSRTSEIIRELPIQIEPPYGRIKVVVPKGEYGLWLRFEDTLPRTIGTILTGVSLLIALGLFVWDLRQRRRKPQTSS